MKEDAEYKRKVLETGEIALDFVESELHKQIKKGSAGAAIFYLKTKGKKRGYIETTEVLTHETAKPPTWFNDEESA